jgi:hypothetical protein
MWAFHVVVSLSMPLKKKSIRVQQPVPTAVSHV